MNVITLALTMATSSPTNLTGTPGRYDYKILMFVLFQQVITSSFVTSGLGASMPTLVGRSVGWPVCLSVCLSLENM